MTVIAAKIIGDKVVVASDSAYTIDGAFKYDFQETKVQQHYDSLIGGSGETGAVNMFFRFLRDEKFVIQDKYDLIDYMSKFYVWLEEKGTKSTTTEGGYMTEFIVVTNGKLYYAGGFVVQERTAVTIGSGSPLSAVAMRLGHTVEAAVACAIESDPYCGGPIHSYTVGLDNGLIETHEVITDVSVDNIMMNY